MSENQNTEVPAQAGEQKKNQRPVFHVTDLYGQLTPNVKRDVLLGLLQWAIRELSQIKAADAEPVALFTLPVNPDGSVDTTPPPAPAAK